MKKIKGEKQKMKMALKSNKGITLVALVITIIVLLILAVVSVKLVIDSGIIKHAQDATKKYSEAEKAEQEKLLRAEYEMAKYEGKFDGSYADYEVNKKYGVRIGDYVEYDPTKDENGNDVAVQTYTSYSEVDASPDKNGGRTSGDVENQTFNVIAETNGWRVLGIENGKLLLISAQTVKSDLSKKYFLKGQKGYVYGIDELNSISGIFGQGKNAESARSINIDDINKITGYSPEKTGDGNPYGAGTIKEYGNKVTFYWVGTDKPYCEGSNGISESSTVSHSDFWWYDGNEWHSSPQSITATPDAREKITELINLDYVYYSTTLTPNSQGEIKGIEQTSKEYDTLFKGLGYYWVASSTNDNGVGKMARFGIRDANGAGFIKTSWLVDSRGERTSPIARDIRPVVVLKDNIQIDKTDETRNGSSLENAWILK